MTGNALVVSLFSYLLAVFYLPPLQKKPTKIKEKMTEVPKCRGLIVTNYGPARTKFTYQETISSSLKLEQCS